MAVKRNTKAKAAALAVPQSDDDANGLLAEYGALFNDMARAKAAMNDRLAAVKAEFENGAAPSLARMQRIFDALNAYAGANRDRLTAKGKTKTVAFASGEMGWRLNPPGVRLKRGFSWDGVAEWLMEHGMRRFLRVKHEVNKEAMLADVEHARAVEGVTIGSSGEEFYLLPFGAELSEPKP